MLVVLLEDRDVLEGDDVYTVVNPVVEVVNAVVLVAVQVEHMRKPRLGFVAIPDLDSKTEEVDIRLPFI